VKPVDRIDVSAATTGRITHVARSGEQVAKGDVLVKLDDATQRALLQRKKAALDLARSRYARNRKLAAKGVVSKSSFQTKQTNVELAKADVAYQRSVVDDYTIRAPFDGEVGFHDLVEGQRIRAGQTLFGFQNVDTLQVEFQVPVDFVRSVSKRGTVSVTSDATGFSASVPITIVAPEADSNTRTVMMRADLPTGSGLRPGMSLRVRYETRQMDKIITLPDIAVVNTAYGASIFVVSGKGKAERRFVKLAGRQGGRVAVKSGIHPGETVVVTGQMRLYPGETVRTKPFTDPSAGPAAPRPAGG
jgi:RND family efflux transporter MFP subunit